MTRKRIPDYLLTPQQLKKRVRNERYRSIKRDDKETASQITKKIEPAQSFETPLRLVANLKVAGEEPAESRSRQASKNILKRAVLSKGVQSCNQGFETITFASKWKSLFEQLAHPEQLFLGFTILILSSYLTFQTFSFFLTMENRQHIALMDAIISEFVLILLAASLAFCLKKTHRFLISIFLLSTIFGLGVFFHRSLSENFAAKSIQIEMLLQEKDLTTKVIARYMADIESFPQNFVAKRQELQKKVDEERMKLSELNTRLTQSHEIAVSNNTNRVSYAFWLRLAAMLLNAYLVHCFFSRLRRTWLCKEKRENFKSTNL